MNTIRITQLDGALPNLALMKLSHWHKSQGDIVVFSRSPDRDLLEPRYDRVYGSAIFKFSRKTVERFLANFPDAIIGGTGTGAATTVEQVIGCDHAGIDYEMYPDFTASIGFTQRGCRFKCSFCVVPGKEGAAHSVASAYDIWRGEGYPRKLHLLDNDFFGQSKSDWRARIAEFRDGGFKISFTQGINIRVITKEIAEAIYSIEYRNVAFNRRKIYTAWDSLGDQSLFFRGVNILSDAGVPPSHIRAFMLVGYDEAETWQQVFHRFNAMVERGIEPYPMVYDCRDRNPEIYRWLKRFQRWVVTGLYRAVPWEDYDSSRKSAPEVEVNCGLLAA